MVANWKISLVIGVCILGVITFIRADDAGEGAQPEEAVQDAVRRDSRGLGAEKPPIVVKRSAEAQFQNIRAAPNRVPT